MGTLPWKPGNVFPWYEFPEIFFLCIIRSVVTCPFLNHLMQWGNATFWWPSGPRTDHCSEKDAMGLNQQDLDLEVVSRLLHQRTQLPPDGRETTKNVHSDALPLVLVCDRYSERRKKELMWIERPLFFTYTCSLMPYIRGPQPTGHRLARIYGLLGTGPHSTRKRQMMEWAKLHLHLQLLPIAHISAWSPPPVRSAAALDSHRRMNPKWNVLESSENHPSPASRGKIVFHKTGPWYQKGWGLLLYSILCGKHYDVHLTKKKTETSVNWTIFTSGASLMAQTVKNMPAMRETWVQSLGQEDPQE